MGGRSEITYGNRFEKDSGDIITVIIIMTRQEQTQTLSGSFRFPLGRRVAPTGWERRYLLQLTAGFWPPPRPRPREGLGQGPLRPISTSARLPLPGPQTGMLRDEGGRGVVAGDVGTDRQVRGVRLRASPGQVTPTGVCAAESDPRARACWEAVKDLASLRRNVTGSDKDSGV